MRRHRNHHKTDEGGANQSTGDGAATWTPPQPRTALVTHAIKAGMWGLVGCGPVALLLAIAGPSSPIQRAIMPPARSGVGPSGFAELYVAAYISSGADSSQLRAFYPEAPSASGQPGRRQVTRTVMTALREIRPGYWDVTVAADVTATRQGGADVSARVHFFSVPVVAVGDAESGGTSREGSSASYVAAALPAEVSAPATAPPVQLGYDSGRSVTSGPMADTVRHFAAAYLTGVGELDRYLSPGATIRPVTPPPYAKTDLVRIVLADQPPNTRQLPDVEDSVPPDGSQARALATVEATDTNGQRWPLTYAITLTARADRWEVSGLDPGPLIAGPGGNPTVSDGAPPPISVEPSASATP